MKGVFFLLRIIVPAYLLFSGNFLFAWTESWHSDRVSIGEKAEYFLHFTKGELQFSEPLASGIYPDPNAPDLPLLEIVSYESSDQGLKVTVVYYASGKYILPLTGEEGGGKEFRSKAEITVISPLAESDRSPEDILPPLEFSGPYFWKLFAIFAAVASLALAGFYAWYWHRTKSRLPVDALFTANSLIQRMLIYENVLDEILQSSPILARNFYRALSGYIREGLSQRMGTSFAHLTEEELFDRIFASFPIDEKEAKSWENLLRKAQYSGNETELSKEEATEAWDYWKGVLGA